MVVFGVKDTSEYIIRHIHTKLHPVSLVITIAPEVLHHNQVSGYKGLSFLTEEYGIPVYEAASYGLKDEETLRFLRENTFDLGITMGWQRLIPGEVLDRFQMGIFGFHGNCGYLPFGRGRSPLNWSIILGDQRFNLNLFRYDEEADSPNVFATETFSLNEQDDIRTAQYKNMICSRRLIERLCRSYEQAKRDGGEIPIRRESKDFDSWYEKRTSADGKIDLRDRTRHIYNLIRGVAAPFPGAFCFVKTEGAEKEVRIWRAQPFDDRLDFSGFAPGEVIDVFDGNPVIRTVDGSLLITEYTCDAVLEPGMLLY